MEGHELSVSFKFEKLKHVFIFPKTNLVREVSFNNDICHKRRRLQKKWKDNLQIISNRAPVLLHKHLYSNFTINVNVSFKLTHVYNTNNLKEGFRQGDVRNMVL